MKKIKTVLGYTWVVLGFIIIPLTFVGMDLWKKKLFVEPGIKVSARWSGGEIVQTIDHQNYQTHIHRPVFDGILWQKSQGFVQIDWKSRQQLPELINEEFDYDKDGNNDFRIRLNTKTNRAVIISFNPKVLEFSEEDVLVYKNERIVRVIIKNS